MKRAARKGQSISLESFVDVVWAVPFDGLQAAEPAGRLLHRAASRPSRARRIVLLRGVAGSQLPSLMVF